MKHLILCRELPPANYPPGGIGTYVAHISRVLAEHGETVHVIGQRWEGAHKRIERLCDGRLIIHRIAADDVMFYPSLADGAGARHEMRAMLQTDFQQQWFSWVACGLAERLVEQEGIDVIEGQEWEAPLYYFMLRRALGLGPERQPPCIVHLHSPSEFIFRHNDRPQSRPGYSTMKRLEDYVIKAADAHLCPSHFLADQCTEHYALEDPVGVIPLPLGKTAPQERSPETWVTGSICYSGRLEPRKGVIEFVEAAIGVARDIPSLRFDFIGSDNEYDAGLSVQQLVERRIPAQLRGCFKFHGGKPRSEVLTMLRHARIGVVPSRWENFPNTCVEAMSSGLPVLATRNGGMAEMVEDGVTGWLAADGSAPLAERLAEALRRAVATPPERLAQMGRAAAVAIGAQCDNQRVAELHVAFRDQVRKRGSHRSLSIPESYPWPDRTVRPVARRAAKSQKETTAVAVVALGQSAAVVALRSLARQTRRPDMVVLISEHPETTDRVDLHIPYRGACRAEAKRLAIAAAPSATRWMFLDGDSSLQPTALGALEDALARAPAAGLIASWTEDAESRFRLAAAPPAFPYQWVSNELAGPALYRTEAITMAGGFGGELARGHEEWALASAIMAAGWGAVRLPGLLATRSHASFAAEQNAGRAGQSGLQIASRFPDLAGPDMLSLVPLLTEASIIKRSVSEFASTGVPTLGWILALPFEGKVRMAVAALRRPDWTARFLARRLSAKLDSLRYPRGS